MRRLLLLLPLLFACERGILIEAESFDNIGGWSVDNQSVAAMGSPYLLAHGLGVPVEDAKTEFTVPHDGTYRVWVRTRDWVKPWNGKGSPGKFNVLIDNQPLDTIFGIGEASWHWQNGGTVSLKKGISSITLHDLTGFEGRCDAIWITSDLSSKVPDPSRNESKINQAGEYDFVVVGGGIAGCSAAITAARLGCKVALIQDRPVLGGNNSSEVRVGLSGRIFQQPYPKLGALLDQLGGVGFWNEVEAREDTSSDRSRKILEVLKAHPEKLIHNAGPASNYEDERKEELVRFEKNIDLYLGWQVMCADMHDNSIMSVTARNVRSGERLRFRASVFADCTGDGNLGYIAGADFRVGRESRAMTGEPDAPETADSLVMGMSVQWYSEEGSDTSSFPECPWAIQFSESTAIPIDRGEWDWEAGIGRDQIMEAEYIRDLALRAVYGNWSWLKANNPAFANKRLAWVAHIGGKRESRRLLGDVILSEQDLLEGRPYDDASFTTTWSIDLHYPIEMSCESFRARSVSRSIKPYAVPYRCLYSRNINNLFMAGRDISVTHIALGSVRVMRTAGMMGEVVGMAAWICTDKSCKPRDVYNKYLPRLKQLMQ